jgi:gamma-glutamylcyclotransferase (GGCT)/AIG2-like uncharacterized protein YtfP
VDDTDVTRLFVYGTLRRGAPMHALIASDARLVGPATLAGRLYDLGAYPAFSDRESKRDVVRGELYDLAPEGREALLDSLDRYEGRSFERVLRSVTCDDGSTAQAFVYLFRGKLGSARRVRSGDYLAAS